MGRELVEFPITILERGLRVPAAGGGYFRFFPYAFSRWALKSVNKEKHPFVFYIHPWKWTRTSCASRTQRRPRVFATT